MHFPFLIWALQEYLLFITSTCLSNREGNILVSCSWQNSKCSPFCGQSKSDCIFIAGRQLKKHVKNLPCFIFSAHLVEMRPVMLIVSHVVQIPISLADQQCITSKHYERCAVRLLQANKNHICSRTTCIHQLDLTSQAAEHILSDWVSITEIRSLSWNFPIFTVPGPVETNECLINCGLWYFISD